MTAPMKSPPLTDQSHLDVIEHAAIAFSDACADALRAGLELDIRYERQSERHPPVITVEIRRWIGRRNSKRSSSAKASARFEGVD